MKSGGVEGGDASSSSIMVDDEEAFRNLLVSLNVDEVRFFFFFLFFLIGHFKKILI